MTLQNKVNYPFTMNGKLCAFGRVALGLYYVNTTLIEPHLNKMFLQLFAGSISSASALVHQFSVFSRCKRRPVGPT